MPTPWKHLYIANNWNHETVVLFDAPPTAFPGWPAIEAAEKFDLAAPYEVRWPDGTVEPLLVELQREHYEIYDHGPKGHGWQDRPFVLIDHHGATLTHKLSPRLGIVVRRVDKSSDAL